MSAAPYQLWVDYPAVASAVRTSGTVTITTASSHGLVAGAVIHLQDITGTAGTSMNGAWTVGTVTSGTVFAFTSAGSAGTATVTDDDGNYTAALAVDLLNPLDSYSQSDRNAVPYVITESLQMAASGDGAGATMGFTVMQDDTPAVGPWYLLIPDESRVRLIPKSTGTSPSTDGSDVLFIGTISSLSARLNGAGQGTETNVEVADVNSVLDRLVVFGKPISAKQIRTAAQGGMSRTSNVVTVKTTKPHGYSAGMSFTITQALGGNGTSFNGSNTISTVPNSTTFTFAQTGSNASLLSEVPIQKSPVGWSKVTNSPNKFRITCSDEHGVIDGQTIKVANLTSTNTDTQNMINATFTGSAVRRVNATVLELTISGRRTSAQWGTAGVGADPYIRNDQGVVPTVTPGSGANQGTIGINGNESEVSAVSKMLGVVASNKGDDYSVNRLLKTSVVSEVSGSSQPNDYGLSFPAGTLRATLDSIVEAYSGMDQKARRYYVDTQGKLVYKLTDPTAVPTYANAPYKIITSGIDNPNTTSSAATLLPYSLEVEWDHRSTKEALVITSSIDNSPGVTRVQNYVDSGYTKREMSPRFDDVIEAPSRSTNASAQVGRVASAFFLERHKPILSGSFTVRGAGTQGFNQYGYDNGYAQTGVSSFALVSGWKPGQWVDVTCSELGLSGLYRIEQVDWGLESGSFTSFARITFNRRPASMLTQLLNSGGA